MRLLKRDRSGWLMSSYIFSLATFDPRYMPCEYAILLYRWRSDEVTLKDIENGTARSKADYRKLEFRGDQAARDGLMYFWIDTCSIEDIPTTRASSINI